MASEPKVTTKVIRDKAFARRLDTACNNHPLAPSGHGKQKWVRDEMLSRFNVKLSPEGVRKWFAGESRPRPKVMSDLARLLEVDEAWLSLGITPEMGAAERRKQNAVVNGYVNLIAGIIQINGGHIAFPEEGENAPDIYAIIGGRQLSIEVRTPTRDDEGTLRFRWSALPSKRVCLGVLQGSAPFSYEIVRFPTDVIDKHGTQRGGYTDLNVVAKQGRFQVEDAVMQPIRSISDLAA